MLGPVDWDLQVASEQSENLGASTGHQTGSQTLQRAENHSYAKMTDKVAGGHQTIDRAICQAKTAQL
jgi:hypothetical protein